MKKIFGSSITTEEEYNKTMHRIHQLMIKGEANLNLIELNELKLLALAAESFEDKNHPFNSCYPKTSPASGYSPETASA
jgi:antitoxin component HigA of HigAB toxin-antitoxin module